MQQMKAEAEMREKDYKTSISELSKEAEDAGKRLAELQKRNTALIAQNTEIQKRSTELERKYADLKKKYDSIVVPTSRPDRRDLLRSLGY